jgi:hypothetical protein
MKIFNRIIGSLLIYILLTFLGCQEKKELTPKMTTANWEGDIEYLFNTLEKKTYKSISQYIQKYSKSESK